MLKSDYSKENLELFASFKRLDEISGTIKGYKNALRVGIQIKKPKADYNLDDISDNQVY